MKNSLVINEKPPFLIESALLTHGLPSLSNQQLVEKFGSVAGKIVWVDQGKIVIGTIGRFVKFRDRADKLIRIDLKTLKKSLMNGLSGALTASGTMAVCTEMGIVLAVSAGMGGISQIKGKEFSADLAALEKLPVALIATSPKDMMDIQSTIDWLHQHQVVTYGKDTNYCTGFLFTGPPVELTDTYIYQPLRQKMLLLCPIPANLRIQDRTILDQVIAAGNKAEYSDNLYHPTINAQIDLLTKSVSSQLQLNALINNIRWAHAITSVSNTGLANS